ncbi:MAG: hypothetical protein DMG57_31210 [Acidobacteria bacterium]|nr:MAG: hypothetical protein DMG57_31210 [Acidobacteriota bacterium]
MSNCWMRCVPCRPVQAVSISNTLPARGQTDVTVMEIRGGQGNEVAGVHSVDADYFRVFRIPLRSGRGFTDRDRTGAPKVLVLNENAARKLWPGQNPIGQHVLLPVWDTGQQDAKVIGVVGDVRYDGVDQPAQSDVYVSFRQYPESGNIVVRTAGDPLSLAPAIRRAVHALDKDLPVFNVKSMDQQLADATSRARFSAVLLGVFAALALLLAALGIYGVVASSVAARTREIGIRIALGAGSRDVRKLVAGDGLLLCLAGVLLGIPAALAATCVLTSVLYGTRPGQPVTYIVVSVLLMLVAALASHIPARRATKVDPLVALRYE